MGPSLGSCYLPRFLHSELLNEYMCKFVILTLDFSGNPASMLTPSLFRFEL